MIKINLLGDALAQAGAKKGGDKASAEPVEVYMGEGGSRSSLPIAGVVATVRIDVRCEGQVFAVRGPDRPIAEARSQGGDLAFAAGAVGWADVQLVCAAPFMVPKNIVSFLRSVPS